jgi:uncharacterized protein YjeT (DUF2065 family)
MADKFQLKAILTAVDKISPTLKNITRGTRLMHKTLRDIGNAGSELMRKIGIPAFLSFSAVTYGAIRATKAAMDYAGSIQDAADRTGASVEGYQAMTNMLGLVGGTAEDAEMAFTKFNKGVAEASSGGDKNFAGLMKKLGIPLKDAKGQLVGLEAILPQLAVGFAKNTNPAMQTRMAMELFGKSGTKIIPLLKGLADGSISLEQAMKEIVNKKAITDLDNMGDSITALGTKTKNTLTNALAKMVPVIQPIIDSMSKWVTANQGLIQSTIVSTLTDVANGLKSVFTPENIKNMKDTLAGIRNVIDRLGGLKAIVIGMGIAWAAGPIAAIGTIAGALYRLGYALLFSLGPIGLIVAAIAGVGAIIYANWGTIGPTIMSAISPLLKSFSGLWDSTKNLFGALSELWDLLAPVLIPVLKVLAFIVGQVLLLALESLILVFRGVATYITAMIDIWISLYKIVAKVAGMLIPDWLKNMMGKETKIDVKSTQKQLTENYSPLEPNNAQRPNFLAGTNQAKVNGEVVMRFENAPAGFRVDSAKTNQSALNLNPDIGYRRGLEAFAL